MSLSKKRKVTQEVVEIDLTGGEEEDVVSIQASEQNQEKPGNGSSHQVEAVTPSNGLAKRFLLLDICLSSVDRDTAPRICLLGKAADGKQIVRIRINSFLNYFYADAAKHSREELLALEGVLSVESCERRPLFYYRAPPKNLRRFWKVSYSFSDPKRRPKSDEGFYETEIKLRRRFQVEKALGAGCTVEIANLNILGETETLFDGECDHADLKRLELKDEIPISILSVVAIEAIRVHNPARAITGRCYSEKNDPLACIALTSSSQTTLFVLNNDEDTSIPSGRHVVCGRMADIRLFKQESDLISQFADALGALNPDVIVGWELIPALESLGALSLSRMDPSLRLKTRLMTNYNANWVRRPNARMTSNSNQETFKVECGAEGRILIDLLRTTTTKQKLRRYTLEESVQVFLLPRASPSERPLWMDLALETFAQRTVSETWRAHANRFRVLEIACARSLACLRLEVHHSLTAETLEGARLAMLPVWEVLYGAQVVRVHSLLLRKMFLLGLISAGALPGERGDGVLSDPINAPFLIDPEEAKTQKLFTLEADGPVAVLDFVSLYPSIIIAFNLCYTTYIHENDLEKLYGTYNGPGSLVPPPRMTGSVSEVITCAPAYPQTKAVERHHFVTQKVAQGVLPRLLQDLLREREDTKQLMAALPAGIQKTVLNERQNQLKLCANAAYGFTGAAMASPLAFTPIAESVLRFGQALCRKAVSVVQKEFPESKVIYGQTDSVFIALGPDKEMHKHASAKAKADLIAEVISAQIGRAPIRLRLEKLYDRLFLQGVNRYAGREMESQRLDIAGLESDSRKECALVRRAMKELLVHVLQPNVPRYVSSMRPLPQPSMSSSSEFVNHWLEQNLPRTLPSELIITHALWRTDPVPGAASSTDAEENQPHLAVARLQASKDSDVSFVLGERVCFVFRAIPNAKKQADKARGPFDEPRTDFDLILYLKNKLLPPVGRVVRVMDPTGWKKVDGHWSSIGKVVDSVVPKSARKCLGEPNCRLLVQNNEALCGKCRDELHLLPAARARWEAERARMERKVHLVLRARQRSHLMRDASSLEFAALDHAHLVEELVRLDALFETRKWA